MGNLTGAENAARKYQFTYDALGRLATARDFDLGEEIDYVYDPEGARTMLSWQNGAKKTRYAYGKAGELLTVTDPEGGLTSFAYDELLREISRSQPNGIRTLRSYDPAGRLAKVKTEGGPGYQEKKLSSEAYVYDASGKRIYTVDEKGQITAYRYDAEGRLSTVFYPFKSGKPAADFGERLHYGLYPSYEMTEDGPSAKSFHGAWGTAESGADLALLPDVDIPGFDAQAFLGEIGAQLDEQDAVIREATMLKPGSGSRWILDKGVDIARFLVPLNPTAEEITAIKAAAIRANGRNTSIETNPYQWVETFEYDSRNNRSAKTNGWGRIEYAYDSENRMLSAGKRSYQYDADGNMVIEAIGSVQATIAYDYENRPVDAYTKVQGFYGTWYGSKLEKLKAGVRYEYDPFGRRVERAEYVAQQKGHGAWGRAWDTENATTYLYDGLSMDILAEARDWDYDPGDIGLPYMPWYGWGQWGHHGYSRGNPWNRSGHFYWKGNFKPESEYIYAQGQVIQRMDYNPTRYSWGTKTTTEYYTSDILGSTMMLTDRYGKVSERYEYDAFGSLYEGAFARLNAVGYTGKHNDTKSGRYDYGFREYSPSLGRFSTKDPIKDGANWYAYCGNEPINHLDPNGLHDETIVKITYYYNPITKLYEGSYNTVDSHGNTAQGKVISSIPYFYKEQADFEFDVEFRGMKITRSMFYGKELTDILDLSVFYPYTQDSKLLRENLEFNGEDPQKSPGKGYAAHHIVPKNHPGAEEARLILKLNNIDINHHENGVWLKEGHYTTYSQAYMDWVNTTLRNANKYGRDKVLEALKNMKEQLIRDGGYKCGK